MKTKKAEIFGMSFSMIFSIILIVAFIAAASIGIKALITYQKNIEMVKHNVAWFNNPAAIQKVTEMAVLKLENLLSP